MKFFCYVLEKKDDFDWGQYLMEGEEIDLGPNVDTPNWSEDSEDEDDQQPLSREDSGIQVDRTPLEEQDQNRKLGSCVSWKGTMPHCLVVGQAWESIYMI
ncbi:gamma-tubulin complex component 5-like [Ailuropoda melanoleuca]|uniref:gamma-tubulin complex component 5-like n=1 Tax=Ailuropoda melanoleuca TaxID=9646 RepID=UPI00149467CD|nr:gamma-tubulin complex component 5-like [Ailuropoda melanoleuca]